LTGFLLFIFLPHEENKSTSMMNTNWTGTHVAQQGGMSEIIVHHSRYVTPSSSLAYYNNAPTMHWFFNKTQYHALVTDFYL
jgi:hypothetical protein